MAALLNQRELLSTFKQEILSNLEVLHTIHQIPVELHRQLFREDALEKPSQNVFLYLCYYLIRIITPKNTLPWPLYDTNTERTFKKELANIVVQYQSTGLVSPVMSSYFVNPGCFKVIKLTLQLSQLATQTVLQQKLTKPSQKEQFNDISGKFKSNSLDNFNEICEEVRNDFYKKVSCHISYKKKMEAIASILRQQIVENESECRNVQEKINKLIDTCPERSTKQIEAIKLFSEPSTFFQTWLTDLDRELDLLENTWNTKVTEKLLKTSNKCFENTKTLLSRHSGEADRKSYCLQYDPEKDAIDTSALESVCTTQQKYVLKNIVKEKKLDFPFLVRGFIVSICYMLKNVEVGDDIYGVAECMGKYRRDMGEALTTARILMSKLISADAALQPLQLDTSLYTQETEYQDIIPPLPDLTINEDHHHTFDSFTPINIGRRNFNIQRKYSLSSIKHPRVLLNPPPREDYLRTIISCRVTALDRSMVQNTSAFPHPARMNETVSDCSTGFSTQQIMRLLSTKKKASSKKKKDREEANVKVRGSLFESSVESINGLFRSHSSPDLYEIKTKRIGKLFKRTDLAPMLENSPCFSELSGIATLDCNSKESTPINSFHSTSKNVQVAPEIGANVQKENFDSFETEEVKLERTSLEKNVTPKVNKPVRKPSSIEKIINRYKKVRAKVSQSKVVIQENLIDEKENLPSELNTDNFSSSKILLPDLLSPSCSGISKVSDKDWHIFNVSDEFVCNKKPRESLGTILGVDNTFLDQFELID